jgi:hypothetical protein
MVPHCGSYYVPQLLVSLADLSTDINAYEGQNVFLLFNLGSSFYYSIWNSLDS